MSLAKKLKDEFNYNVKGLNKSPRLTCLKSSEMTLKYIIEDDLFELKSEGIVLKLKEVKENGN
jgi:hypothetical protein